MDIQKNRNHFFYKMELKQHKINILVHIAVWIVYLVLLTWFFLNFHDLQGSLFRSVVIVGIHAIVFYLNLLVLMPKFLEKKQYILYFIFVIGLVALVVLFFNAFDRMTGVEELSDKFRRQGPPHRRGHGRIFLRHFEFGKMIINGIIVVGVLFISTVYRNISESRRREKNEIALKNKILEAETMFLKSQMNPHFLFNTLNNIYSLSIAKSEKTPDAIHRLSEMLRYVLYESNEKYVNLEKELKYIQSYIQLQLLKDEEIKNVNIEIKNIDKDLKIAPMILIPFVENSFKHSKIEDVEKGWIDLKIETDNKQLIFSVDNSIPSISLSKDAGKGVGLKNTKRRLELIYPGRYSLNIIDTEKRFSVQLKLYLDEN